MSLHFAQKYVYVGSGEHAWFADLDPKTQLRDKADLADGNDCSEPSYRALFSRLFVKPVVDKVRILRYRLKHRESVLSRSCKPAKHDCTIRWAEADLQRQEQEARERHGPHEYTIYQLDQPRIRVQRLRKRYLQKRERLVWKADFVPH
jgi:hypothetical protein